MLKVNNFKAMEQEIENLIKECEDIIEQTKHTIQINDSTHTQYYVGYKAAIQDILTKLNAICKD